MEITGSEPLSKQSSGSDNNQSCLDVYVGRRMSQARLKGNTLVVNIFYDLGVGAVSVGM